MDREQEVRALVEAISGDDDTAARAAIGELAAGLLLDVERVADAMEKLATPPEVTLDVDTDRWQAQQDARDQREERTLTALESIAGSLEKLANELADPMFGVAPAIRDHRRG